MVDFYTIQTAGVRILPPWLKDGYDFLLASDKILAAAASRIDVPHFTPRHNHFSTLLALITEQQISVKAASAVWKRLADALNNIITPDAFLRLSDDTLRAIGLSGQKIKYAQDLAQHVADGRIDCDAFPNMTDDDIAAQLLVVKGIGRWTVENYLMFALQRPDVWPAGDIALQHGVRKLYGDTQRPSIKAMDELAAKWQPHRTAAALLLWKLHEGI